MPTRPEKTKGGGKDQELSWMVTYEYTELQCMKDWGLTPKEWRAQPKEDRIKMLAFSRVKAKMEAMDNDVMSKRMDRASSQAKTAGNKPRGNQRGWR